MTGFSLAEEIDQEITRNPQRYNTIPLSNISQAEGCLKYLEWTGYIKNYISNDVPVLTEKGKSETLKLEQLIENFMEKHLKDFLGIIVPHPVTIDDFYNRVYAAWMITSGQEGYDSRPRGPIYEGFVKGRKQDIDEIAQNPDGGNLDPEDQLILFSVAVQQRCIDKGYLSVEFNGHALMLISNPEKHT
jgi:hypothetical protein